MMINYQQEFLNQIRSGQYQGGSIPPDILLVAKVLELINEYFAEKKSLEFYCTQLNSNIYRLNLLLTAVFGKTLHVVIQDRIHFEAVHLLLHSTMTAQEISFKIGMDNPPYFSRNFKRLTGYTPIEFRSRFKKIGFKSMSFNEQLLLQE